MGRLYINPTLERDIRVYCEANGIEDINAFANRCAMQGLNIIKYGMSPSDNVNRENNGIKDVKKNEKSKKEKPNGENSRKQKEPQTDARGKEPKESVKPVKEREVVVRKIQVIKKK